MAASLSVDQKVFVRSPTKSWLPGVITAKGDKGTYTVVDEDREELQKVHSDDVTPLREDLLLEGIDPVVHDLLFLTVLHDATLLRCLKVRYMKNIVYTNIGAIVVALNPFNFHIPWYQDTEMDKYLSEGDVIRTNLPHSWAIAHNTYFEMINDKKNQSILVSGESGAGKTEACKMVLKYLGRVSMTRATEEQLTAASLIRDKIQKASPILEGFGNAKTVRNHNSSRFGKFINVKFHEKGYLQGAFTSNYLLEKSRIITAAKNERVYHSFYHLTKGKDAASMGVKKPQEYRATFSGKCIVREDSDDTVDYDEVNAAFALVGFDADSVQQIWRTVAGCLVAQNIELAAIDADTTCVVPASKPFLTQAAEFWGISAESVEKEMLTTTNVVRGETFVMNLRLAQATDMRDALCKHAYEKLFQSLVNKINASTDCEGSFDGSTISVLDIFGFEDFDTGNSFEQVCINLANEALQNHYNNYIFKKDMEECRSEGINVDDVRAPDNTECLKLIMDNQNGIFAYLDEECRLGTGTDDGFLQKIIQNCSVNPHFSFKPLQPSTFVVRHYAGSVTYTVKGFLEKNRDSLKTDMQLLLRSSKYPLIAALLPDPAESGKTKGPKTIASLFKQQVMEMMAIIHATNPHWIRCVKPHPAKKPLLFDGVQVMNQLNSSGVLGTVKIRKAGYPVRLAFANFLARYRVLIGRSSPTDPPAEIQRYVAKAAKAARQTGKEVQCGKTRVFMKSEAFYELEKTKDEAGMKHRVLLQAAARCVASQLVAREKRWTVASTSIQVEFRDYLRRTAKIREERRIAREKLLASQQLERHQREQQFCGHLRYIEDEEEDERRRLSKRFYSETYWLEDKLVKDIAAREQLQSLEASQRGEVFTEFMNFLTAQLGPRARLYLLTTPEVEAAKRARLFTDETREFNILLQLFSQAGSAMFRVEIERSERRMRRLMGRLEDLQRMETRQRFTFFRDFVDSLYRSAKDHIRVLRGVKEHAVAVARRAAARVTVRERKQQAEFFTNRHPGDTTRLWKELSHLSVGVLVPKTYEYTRVGDKVADDGFAGQPAWMGSKGIPDIDQVLRGAVVVRRGAAGGGGGVAGIRGSSPSVGGGSPYGGASPDRAGSLGGREGSPAAAGGAGASPYDILSRRSAAHRNASAGISLTDADSRQASTHHVITLDGPATHTALFGPTSSASVSPSHHLRGLGVSAAHQDTIYPTNVFETFRDPMDEMAFLRKRHIVSRELRDLKDLGKYQGDFFHETNITTKKKLSLAEEQLQRISAAFSETLVAVLQKLNAFCLQQKIPEQDVTGVWKPFTPVSPACIADFPPCTDWRLLLSEQRRLHYAVENFKGELQKVIRGCAARGAKISSPHSEKLLRGTTRNESAGYTNDGDDDEVSVEVVYKAYQELKGYFATCSHCLYPMAPKCTLVAMRLLWPKVEDTTFRGRCRECMAGVTLPDSVAAPGSPIGGYVQSGSHSGGRRTRGLSMSEYSPSPRRL